MKKIFCLLCLCMSSLYPMKRVRRQVGINSVPIDVLLWDIFCFVETRGEVLRLRLVNTRFNHAVQDMFLLEKPLSKLSFYNTKRGGCKRFICKVTNAFEFDVESLKKIQKKMVGLKVCVALHPNDIRLVLPKKRPECP